MPAEYENPFSTCFTKPGQIPFIESEPNQLGEMVGRFVAANNVGQILGPHGSGKTTITFDIQRQLATQSDHDIHFLRKTVGENGKVIETTGQIARLGCSATPLPVGTKPKLVLMSRFGASLGCFLVLMSRLGASLGCFLVLMSRLGASLGCFFAKTGASAQRANKRAHKRNAFSIKSTSRKRILVLDGFERLPWFARTSLIHRCQAGSMGLLITSHQRIRGLPIIAQRIPKPNDLLAIVRHLIPESDQTNHLFSPQRLDAIFEQNSGNLRESLMTCYDEYEANCCKT